MFDPLIQENATLLKAAKRKRNEELANKAIEIAQLIALLSMINEDWITALEKQLAADKDIILSLEIKLKQENYDLEIWRPKKVTSKTYIPTQVGDFLTVKLV